MVYEKDENGKEIYLVENGNQIYAKDDMTDNQILARDENGNFYYAVKNQIEYVPINVRTGVKLPILDSIQNETLVYPCDLTTGYPVYDRDLNGIEKYWESQKVGEYYGKMKSKNQQVYAKDTNTGREILAIDSNGHEYYAQIDGKEYYPKDADIQWQEYYKTIHNKEIPTKEEEYTKDENGNEYYPKQYLVEP